MTAWIWAVWAILHKDLTREFRTWERLVAMASFAILTAILFNYALDRTEVDPARIASGLIWMTVLFSGLLGLGRTFHLEEEEDALVGLLLTPIPREALYFGKVAANAVLLGVIGGLLLGVFGLFFGLEVRGNPWALAGVMALGIVGFTAVGTLFSAISAGTTMGESLLPLLVFPLLVPLILFGGRATALVLSGGPAEALGGPVRMLGAFAVLALVTGGLLFRYVVEE
ncbi:MAG: heme exporter protein CcmB [Gemmatimonadota bacterium]